MIRDNPQGVSVAFETLLERVESGVDVVNTVGSRSSKGRVYSRDGEAGVGVCVPVLSFRPRLAGR